MSEQVVQGVRDVIEWSLGDRGGWATVTHHVADAAHGIGHDLFRGHADSEYELVPHVFRGSIGSVVEDWATHEQRLLDVFKRHARPYVESIVDNREWLSLARHHGVPTRLLDWTTSPLVALWFAACGRFDRDGEIFQLRGGYDVGLDFDPLSPGLHDDITKPIVLKPVAVSPRINSQRSVLTVHQAPQGRNAFVALDSRPEAEGVISRLTIPASCKRTILDDLTVLGLDRATLFPGLDGIGSWLADLHDYDVYARKYSDALAEALGRPRVGGPPDDGPDR